MFSLTQAGNLTAFAGLVVWILGMFKVQVATEEVQSAIAAVVSLVGIVTSWIGRYRAGGVTIAGVRR